MISIAILWALGIAGHRDHSNFDTGRWKAIAIIQNASCMSNTFSSQQEIMEEPIQEKRKERRQQKSRKDQKVVSLNTEPSDSCTKDIRSLNRRLRSLEKGLQSLDEVCNLVGSTYNHWPSLLRPSNHYVWSNIPSH